MEVIYRKDSKEGYQAYINGGCMNYRDAEGAYRIPLGGRTHFCLLKLEDNAQVTRSLEIDLLTGNVYYRVDNHTDSLLAYYYDISLSKVWNNRILRLVHSIRDENLKPLPEIKRAIQKLPCDDWVDVLSVIPGFREAFETRYDRLFLPYEEVETICLDASALEDAQQDAGEQEFLLYEAVPGSERRRPYAFRIMNQDGQYILHYSNQNIGAEFFDEDEAYERVLNPVELCWIRRLVSRSGDPECDAQIKSLLIRFLRREIFVAEESPYDY